MVNQAQSPDSCVELVLLLLFWLIFASLPMGVYAAPLAEDCAVPVLDGVPLDEVGWLGFAAVDVSAVGGYAWLPGLAAVAPVASGLAAFAGSCKVGYLTEPYKRCQYSMQAAEQMLLMARAARVNASFASADVAIYLVFGGIASNERRCV